MLEVGCVLKVTEFLLMSQNGQYGLKKYLILIKCYDRVLLLCSNAVFKNRFDKELCFLPCFLNIKQQTLNVREKKGQLF